MLNKLKLVYGIVGVGLFSLLLIDLIGSIEVNNVELIYLVMFVYSISKLFQDTPFINISIQTIEFKMLKLWQLKGIVLLKCIYSAFIIINILFLLQSGFSSGVIVENDGIFKSMYTMDIVFLSSINICANIVGFKMSQLESKMKLRIVSILYFSTVYFLDLTLIGLISVIVLIINGIRLKYVNYDLLIPFAHSYNNFSEGLITNNMELIASTQNVLMNSKSVSKINLVEKYYSNPKHFFFFKEISRALYYDSKLINTYIISFIIGISLLMMEISSKFIFIIGFFILVLMCDSFLTLLNSVEVRAKEGGFYFPYELKEVISQKYFAHLIIISFPFLCSLFLVEYVSLISILGCYLLLPLRSIVGNYYSKKAYGYKLINLAVISIFLINILN